MFGEAFCLFERYIAGEDERGVCGAVVGAVEAGDVVARQGANAVERAYGCLAVGLVSVEEAGADAPCDCEGRVALLRDGDEALLADALDVIGVEGGVQDDVGEEIEGSAGVVGEEGDGRRGRVHGRDCGQASTDALCVICEPGRVAGLGAFIEQSSSYGGETGLACGIVLAARAGDDACREYGELLVLDDIDLQAVLQRKGLGDREMEGDGGAGRGYCLAPALLLFKGRGIGWGELDVGVSVVWAAGDVVDDLFARYAGDDDGLVFVEVFVCGLLDAGNGSRLIAREVLAEIAGVAGVLVVVVERVGDTTEAAESFEADDLLREVDDAGGVELPLGGAFGLESGDLLPEGGFEGPRA